MATSAIQQHGFFHNLFAPLPEEKDPPPAPKDPLDHVAGYADTASGSWDFFRVVDLLTQCLQQLPNLSDAFRDSASKVSKVANVTGIGLSVPMALSDLNTVKKKTGEFITALNLNDKDPLRQQKVMQAGKGAFLSTVWLTNTISQAIIFLHESGLVKLAQYFPVADGVYQGSSFIADSVEFVDQVYKLDAYGKAQPATKREATEIEEKKRLAWMVIVKDVASVALAVIALVGIAFGIAIFAIPAVAAAGLALSVVWLAAKISSYFYREIIKERHAAPTLVAM